MNKRSISLTLILIILFFLGGCSIQEATIEKKSENGRLDLTQFNIKNEIIPLDGDWAFYWNQLLEPANIDQGTLSAYVPFPSSWNKYQIDDEKIPGSGYATYRLKFTAADNQILALKIPKVRTAYKLFINGEPITTVGTIGTTRETMVPKYQPQVVAFNAVSGENEIVLEVSNFYRPSGGLLNSIQLGGESQLLTIRYFGLTYELFLFGALMMMGVYHLALFCFRRKDRAPLYFGLFCTLVAIRTLFIGEAFLFSFFQNLNFEIIYKVQTLSFYLGVPLILMFFRSILPQYFNPLIVRTTQIIAGVYTLVVLFTPTWIAAIINPLYQIWTVLMIIYLFAMLIKIALHREKNSGLIILGGLFLIATCLMDIITLSPWISDNWLSFLQTIFQGDANSSTGQLIFAVLYSLLLAKTFTESLEQRTVMSEQLAEMNDHLDELVAQRTRELTASNDRIEQQNYELELINHELQRLSLRDPLTELWNRRKYDETIVMEWNRCLRQHRPISLLFIDVDYFKNYNDLYGHVAGDATLIKIGNTLRTALSRPTDMVVRYGGEEFIVLLAETDKEEALSNAHRLLKKVEALAIPHEGSVVKNCITVSIGVATLLPDHHSRHEDLVKMADEALYQAKSNGRNQVVTLNQ
ncbi:sensor domain-containing diguanylate cyclase [Acetobacterium wieringae]|uniref:Phytochrome-like protein cph2 n=1 Tax=Acetobacterium wieringae TaxID=52694 RepID=A0A1F2PKZ7_9FIRM|nr:diguanylate cyclase [Acetobacterium wieringae]OFV71655.1 phytochrome-like protein cph2 [Acetobacterium wieringae]